MQQRDRKRTRASASMGTASWVAAGGFFVGGGESINLVIATEQRLPALEQLAAYPHTSAAGDVQPSAKLGAGNCHAAEEAST